MNIHEAREALAAELENLAPDGWRASTETRPGIYSGLIHVGHATEIRLDSLRTYGVDIPVTLWADESSDVDAALKLYTLLSPGEGSILRQVRAGDFTFTAFTAGNVGPRDEGPSGFLAADVVIRIQV